MSASRTEGRARSTRVPTLRSAIVVLQILLLILSAMGPGLVRATDGSPDPSDPPATSEPTTEPTPEPTPNPTPEPTPQPTPDPTPDAPAASTLPFIATFRAGTSDDDQLAAITAAGGTSTNSIPQLRMHAVELSDDALAALRADDSVARVERDRTRSADAAPSDPGYENQWSLPQIGWDLVFGTGLSGSAVVALLDTGVDASHSDLAGQLVAGTSILADGSATADANGHGTAMAGIIAAATDNETGVAGVGYTGVKVMPVTVLGADGTGQDSDIIAGVVWATDNGADVINMSFSNPGFSAALQAAIDYAWANDVVVVAATGNDASSSATYPAGDRGVVGVSNTNQADQLNSSSNYGATAFLGAPGTDIVTLSAGGGTSNITGTSASSAAVAAAAALLRAADPAASNGQIVARLAANADPAGTVDQTGNGRLNLARAIADTSSDSIQPEGVAGDGGPFVGPYVIAAGTLNSATVNGGATTTVVAGADIAAAVTATSQNNNMNNRVGSIWWGIDMGALGHLTECADVTNVINTTATRTFNMRAPSVNGTYNVVFQGFSADNCSSNPTNTLTLANAVVVTDPNPVPTTTSISPTSRFAGDGAFTLTVNGTNFVANSAVRWAGSDRVTTFVSPTELTAVILATDLSTTGTKTITVFNPTPGGGTSNSQTFTVNPNPVPTTTSISPTTWIAGGGSLSLTVNGTDFVASSVVRLGGADRPTTFISSTQLTASIPASDTAATGSRSITVFNPTPGGGTSNAQTLSVISCAASGNIICIDGSMADWDALSLVPSYADNLNDQGGGSGDIEAVRITSGDGNVYVRWDVRLTPNKNKISSDGFSITVDANRDGTPDARIWVLADSAGNLTVQVESPLGTFTTIGSAQQTCNIVACSNGAVSSLEASIPLTALNATGAIIGLQAETRASSSTNSNVKDCVPGTGTPACNGFFRLDTDTGITTVDAGHETTTTLSCPETVRNLDQSTGTCTITVTDTGFDTSTPPVAVTPAAPTGTVHFSVSNGDGTFTPASCTLSPATSNSSTCTVTYTPTDLGTGSHTLTASYAGDTTPIQFSSSSGDFVLAIDTSAPTSAVTFPADTAVLTSAAYTAGCETAAVDDICGTASDTGAAGLQTVEVAIQRSSDSKWWDGSSFSSATAVWNLATGLATWSFPFTPAEGTYTVQSRATDNVGNVETPGAGNTFTIGNSQPTSITDVSGSGTYGGSATLTATLSSGTTALSDKTISFTLNGTPVGTAITNASGVATLTGVSLSGINAGTYSGVVGATFAGDSGYDPSNGTGDLVVNQKAASVTAEDKAKAYGEANPALTATVSGTVGSETLNYTLSTTATQFSAVGPYPITVTLGSNPNYNVTATDGTLTIGKADAVCTVIGFSGDYDGNAHGASGSCLGVEGETLAGLDLGASFTNVPGGTASWSFTDTTGNYNDQGDDVAITIGQKAASVTAEDKAKAYGEANPALTATVSGTVGSETLNYTLSTTATQFSAVGPYPITVTLGSNPNYDVTATDGTLTIGQKAASVTADPKSKTYGEANPPLTATVVGQVAGGDAINYSLATTAQKLSNVGPYAIEVTLGSNPNYNVTKTDGTLTISQKNASVTAEPKAKAYGDDNPALTAVVVGQVAGGDAINYSLATTAQKLSNVGPYAIEVTLGSNPNYNVTKTDGTLTISRAPLAITADADTTTVDAEAFTRQYSDPNPDFTVRYDGFVLGQNESVLGGTLAFDTTATSSSAPGAYDVTPKGLTSSNYTITFVKGTLNVTKEDMDVQQTGLMFFNTNAIGGSTSATVSAIVSEIDTSLGPLAWNTAPLNLQVKFTAYTGGAVAPTDKWCIANVPNGASTGSATASCPIHNLTDGNYELEMRLLVNGYYIETFNTGAVTVTDPGTGFTTGGGWFNDPATGKRSNFGYTVKFLKNGSIQGNSLFIYRKWADLGGLATATVTTTTTTGTGKKAVTTTTTQVVTAPSGYRWYNFIVKSNSMGTLNQLCSDSTGNEPCWATFTGGLNVKAVDRLTGIEYSLGAGAIGNHAAFQVDVTDNGEPGAQAARGPDQYGITVTTSNGIFYQAGQARTTLVGGGDGERIDLDGGNIQVRLRK